MQYIPLILLNSLNKTQLIILLIAYIIGLLFILYVFIKDYINSNISINNNNLCDFNIKSTRKDLIERFNRLNK